MSGRAHPATPWAREAWAALSEERRAAVEAAIPDGHFLSMGAGRHRGDWTIHLMRGEPVSREQPVYPVEVAVVRGLPRIEAACYAAIFEGLGALVPHG